MNLKNAHLMTGDITYIDRVLLDVFGILSANLEDKPFLGDYVVHR
jgi:hypothetical protein